MEQVDRIDGHEDVGGVLVFGVIKLLDRLDGIFEEFLFPVFEVLLGPVAVRLSDIDYPVFTQLADDAVDGTIGNIVTIDEQSDVVFVFFHFVNLFGLL